MRTTREFRGAAKIVGDLPRVLRVLTHDGAERFARVHRRAIVNLEHVVRLEPNEVGGYTARTRNGRAVEISRQAARDLRKRLGLR